MLSTVPGTGKRARYRICRSLGKTLMPGKIEGKKGRERQRMRWLDSIISLMNTNLSKLQEIVENRGAWHAAVHGVEKSQT